MHKKNYFRFISYSLLSTLLVSCASQNNWAPVESLKWSSQDSYPAIHKVQTGDTLYTLAFKYEQDYRTLAKLNGLNPPYYLQTGQRIKIKSISGFSQAARSRQQSKRDDNQDRNVRFVQTKEKVRPGDQIFYESRKPKNNAKPIITPRNSVAIHTKQNSSLLKSKKLGKWYWPAKGKVFSEFSPDQGKKGIDIAGRKGDKIYAASDGVIAYAGSGLGGYGNLIIIKHDNQFLTAYANNLSNLVSEGQKVKAGQIIANMGVINRRIWGIHFEIRRLGKPINPLSYLNTYSP